MLPETMLRQSVAYQKIVEISIKFPNDQDLGRQVRQYIEEIRQQEGTPYFVIDDYQEKKHD